MVSYETTEGDRKLIKRTVKERIASSFISKEGNGRIILGGDAAHVHSVNGGQGLNTGLSDAFALAWRLAFAINRDLPAGSAKKLIQSYDLERRKTAKGVIDVAAALVRDTIREAKQYVATIERNAGYITGESHKWTLTYRHGLILGQVWEYHIKDSIRL